MLFKTFRNPLFRDKGSQPSTVNRQPSTVNRQQEYVMMNGRNQVCKQNPWNKWVIVSMTLLIGHVNADAATVIVTPDEVNRLISGGWVDNHFDDNFSTNASDTQKTLVKTTNTTFNTALAGALGTLGAGQKYQINAARLTVGSDADDYVSEGNVESYLVLHSYDSDTVTWNSFNAGGVAGTDYGTTNLYTGVVDGNTTYWDFTSLIRDFLAGTTTNHGIYFSSTSTGMSGSEETVVANVVWTLDAEIVTSTFTLAVTSVGSGTGIVTGSASYAAGATVNLTATPNAGSTFINWSPSPCAASFTMPANNLTCTATFDLAPVNPPPVDNPPATYVPPPPPPETKVIVSFGGNGRGKVSSNPSGIDCQSPYACNYTFKTGETIQLTPQATGNSRFQNWGNACNDGVISASGKTVYCMAYFVDTTPTNYPLSVTKTGTGDGKVISNPLGIDCGSACQQEFSSTEEVELIAEPVAGSELIGWSGDCDGESSHTHTKMSQNKTCVAQFDALPPPPINHFPLTVTKTGDGNGVVTSQDAQIDCGETCTANYDANSIVTLTAVADNDALFLRWEGDCTGNENSTTITIDKAKSCLVFFDFKEPLPVLPPILNEKLSVEKHGNGQGQITSDPPGLLLHFDDTFGAEASADFPLGQVVKLIVETGTGTTFMGFTGHDPDCEDGEVTLDKSKHCSAHLEIESAVAEPPAPVVQPVVPAPVPPVEVLPPLVSNEACPPKDTLSYYCNAGGQTIGDLNIVENPQATNGIGFLSNAVIIGVVQLNPDTWIANLHVKSSGKVVGGVITGLIYNEGYLGDFVFKGEFIKGGKLGGKILNLSKIFSWFEDVTLTANAHLIGGALKGKIKGDPKKPALLENLRILSGSEVSGVIIGNGVKIDKEVVIEDSTADIEPVDDTQLPALDEQFSAGIGVNDSSYQTRNVAQILSDNVSIRGKMHINQKHVGQKVKIFVTVVYRSSEESAEEFLFTINHLSGLMPWDGKKSSLGENPFKMEETLQTTHSVKIYDGILLATGVVNIQFGYISEDGTVVQSSEGIELVTLN